MNPTTRRCQNCKKDFTIEPEDTAFYNKIGVPAPTFCPRCRMQRRLSIRNERTLYKRMCDLCHKETLSVYSPDKKLTVYCPACYRSDAWDPFSYGRDYDFSKPLFAQLDTLFREVPRPAVNETNLVNCEYCEDCADSKNLYLCFGAYRCEDCIYSYSPFLTKNACDVTIVGNCDRIYEASDCDACYNVRFAETTDESLDSSFLFDCKGCSDCFGGINLRNKKHHIFNKPYSKKEYVEELKKWDLGSYAVLQKAKQAFKELYDRVPHRFAIITNSVNVTGDRILNAKNCQSCFSLLYGAEDLKYAYASGLAVKDGYDMWAAGGKCQLIYEVTGCLGGQRIFFTNNTHYCADVWYSNKCFHSTNLFGCVGLKKKNYCILNKQYSKEEYATLVARIKEQASTVPYRDADGREYRFGEFFPIETMPFAYNEALAQEKFPLTRDEARAAGYPWYDEPKRDYAITMQAADLPDHIRDVTESIFNETIGCAHAGVCDDKCTMASRITPRELAFYRQMNVALPRLCPGCRHGEREKKRSGLTLYHRKCGCGGASSENGIFANTTSHFHGNAACPNEFETTFAPDRSEIVYCEQCYQSELL